MSATLVGLYLGGLAFSLALGIALWRRDRSQLNLDLCAVWVAGAISAFCQGALQQSPFLICLGFSSTVLTNLALARLIAGLAQLKLPFRLYLALYAAGVLSSALIAYAEAPFWLVALPIGLTAPFSALHAGVKALRTAFGRLGTTAKAFLYTALAFVAHNMDFPFLRDRPELASLGMSIALFFAWALTPTAIAAVLERTAEDRGRLLEVEAQKSRFFANISHELRTPLTLILGPIAELIASETQESRQQSLQIVQRNARRLLRMIDDLLDLSRMESGKLKLQLEQIELTQLVREVCELMAPAAAAKRIRLVTPSDDAQIWIRGDAHRVEIVVGNLVNNAIKYTQSGGDVRVTL
ncbi:MAG TPA: histidine kinase dimerization/phospho-acceptor domain-containing protein, partial [Polyangiales bacterium]